MRALALVGALVGCAAADGIVGQCEAPCKPWVNGAACKIGGNMLFSLAAGDPGCSASSGGAGSSTCGTNGASGTSGYKAHFFCAEVDQFSAFKLEGSGKYMTASSANLKNDDSQFSLFAYGAGVVGSVDVPGVNDSSRVPVFQKQHPSCNSNGAYATFLVYNATMTDGEFKYFNGAPVGNGFVNTCSNGRCQFADPKTNPVCIDGPAGQSNCGVCAGGDGEPADVKVLVSYYGTDAEGHRMLSGSSNPLNFRQFAVGDLPYDLNKNINF